MSLRSVRRFGWAAVSASLVTALALAASACLGGGGDFLGESSPTPFFRASPTPSVSPSPTGTLSATASPLATASPEATPSVNVTPVTPFEITVAAENSGLNIRETPSTNSDVLGAIYPGDKKRVTGEAQGEAVEPGNNLWYALDGGGFIYAAFTKKVEE